MIIIIILYNYCNKFVPTFSSNPSFSVIRRYLGAICVGLSRLDCIYIYIYILVYIWSSGLYKCDNIARIITFDCNRRRPPHFCCTVRGWLTTMCHTAMWSATPAIYTKRDLTMFHLNSSHTNSGILNTWYTQYNEPSLSDKYLVSLEKRILLSR
jgi:hypothetical protein